VGVAHFVKSIREKPIGTACAKLAATHDFIVTCVQKVSSFTVIVPANH